MPEPHDLFAGQRMYVTTEDGRKTRWVWIDPGDHSKGVELFTPWYPRHLLAAWRQWRWVRRWFGPRVELARPFGRLIEWIVPVALLGLFISWWLR